MIEFLIVIALAIAILLWWILMPLRAVANDRKLARLAAMSCREPERWPLASVLVPAKNEEASIADAVTSLLEIDYPELEIILIDDRSSDRTGDIADELAQRDARVRCLHLDALPEGWLGKVHALHRGLEISRGEWLLFADADIHFARDTLKRALAYCLENERGFLSLLPRFRDTAGALVGAAQTAFGMILLTFIDPARIADPESPKAMGVGAFNLVRRDYVDAGDGLEWLRLEVADDTGLALLAKSRGARADVLSGQELIEVDWYPTLPQMLDGVMQRLIMGVNYYLGLYLLQCAAVGSCLLAPVLLTVLFAGETPLIWLALSAYAIPSLILAGGMRNFVLPWLPLALLPLGLFVIGLGMLRALVTFVIRGGLYWRGTVYPLRDLRAAQRVKLSEFL